MALPSTSSETASAILCPPHITLSVVFPWITPLTHLLFAFFKIGAQGLCLPQASLISLFSMLSSVIAPCFGLFLLLVFDHAFILSQTTVEDYGARRKKLRQGTLARKHGLWHCARLRAGEIPLRGRKTTRRPKYSRRSSGVERAIGNGEADSSILSGGTIFPFENKDFFRFNPKYWFFFVATYSEHNRFLSF